MSTGNLSVSISGNLQEGQTLTATPNGSVIGYQWQEFTDGAWTAISGAMSSTYVVQEADEGLQIRVQVTSDTETVDSDPTSPVVDISPTLTAPVISGTAQEGQTLTATAAVPNDSDATVTYQWQESFNGGASWSNISGATSLSYAVQETDEGAVLQIVATSSDMDGTGTMANSASTSAVLDIVPTLSTPVISGTAQEGQTLSATAAVANDSDATITYQWQANHGSGFVNIAGATSLSYAVQEADEGATLQVVATSTDADGGGTTATSAPTGAVTDISPALTTPVISGTAQEGQTLTATAAVANDSDATVTYQWQANHGSGFVNIAGATSLSYAVQEADEGATLQVVATSTDADGGGTTATSAPTGAVTDISPALTTPVISGTAQEGQTLTATVAVANDSDATVTYQWQANHGSGFVNITGATSLSYVVQEADEGATLKIVATSTDADGTGTAANSASTSSVLDIVPTLTTPVISGITQEGQTLTATAAVANDSDATVTYQWQANHGSGFVNIAGATSLSYAVQEADEGATLKIVATSTDADGTGTAANSASTSAVLDIVPTLTTPVISGIAQEGQTLSATAAVANDSDATVTYQWQANHGSGFVNIAGATSLSYRVQELDEGATLRIVAVSSDTDGNGTSASSPATNVVVDISPSLTTPVISGTAQEGQTLTATAAVPNDSDATVTYQWQESFNGGASWSNISGATSLSYAVQETDEGAVLQIVATSSDMDGTGTMANSASTSAVLDIVPTLSTPVISGTAQEGQTLSATAAVANDSDATITYQWQANHGSGFVNIAGATSLSYAVQEADEGATLQVVATSTDADGGGTTATSAPTGAVTDISPALTTPVISGTAQEGQTLTATAAVANDADSTVVYQWQTNHGSGYVNIAGATSLSYRVQELDEGATLRIVAVSSDTDGNGTSASSPATNVVVDISPSLTTQVISGTAREGQTLTATAAVANDSDAIVSYQWQANYGSGFVNIAVATNLTYVVQEADEGATLQIVATSSDTDGSGTTATSTATAAVTDISPTLTTQVIGGTAREGQTLTATAAVANDSDATVTYQWQANHGSGYVNIAGAANLTYVVQEADEGATLQIVATSSDTDGSGTTATSTATAAVTDISPTLTTPAISGTAQEGQTLTATAAVANDSDTTITYQWQANHGSGFVNIAGATTLAYLVQEADEGATLHIVATSTDTDSSGTTATSAATATVIDISPTLTTPLVTGVEQEGQTLTATAAVANDSDAIVTYQWQANHGPGFVNIAGATNLTYVAQEADEAATLRIAATSTDADGGTITVYSAATLPVVDIVPTLTTPVISGTAQEGQTLTASAVVANDRDAIVTYQWQANHGSGFVNIAGATSLAYVVLEADEGAALRIVATSSDDDAGGTTATSTATAAVIDISPTLTTPVITGTAQEGQTLTATAAVANDSDATVAYQWHANHGSGYVNIAGATNLTYVVQEADEGATLQIVATLSDTDGSGTTATSTATAAVTDISPTLTTPAISGTAQEGQTLTATAAVANDSDTTITYQWQANHGSGFVNIAGATTLAYLVQEADEGATLHIVATSTDTDSSGTTATSAATATVIDISPTLTTPVISGTAQEGQTLTATAAVANDSDAIVTYQWRANHGSGFVNIAGATSLTYVVQEADEGATLDIVATSSDSDSSGVTETSAATTAVTDISPTLATPVISGTAVGGQTLTAKPAVVNDSDATVAYQWQANHGSGFVNIAGANGLTYVVEKTDNGATLRIVATSTDPDGGGTTATSAATSVVTVPSPALNVSNDPNATSGQVINLSTLLTISDPANVGFRLLELWDSHGTAAAGQFVVNAISQTGGHEIDVSPANIANTVFDAGTSAGTDTLWARLLQANGTLTPWQQFAVTVPEPSLAVNSISSATRAQVINLSSLVTISDPAAVGYQQLELWDSHGTVTGGQFVANSVLQTGGHEIDVSRANVANTVFDAGTFGGTDTLWARLLQADGTLTSWQQFTVTVPAPSLIVTSVSNETTGQVINLSSLVTVSDSAGVGYQQLELWDSHGTVTGGQFVINSSAQTGGHEIDVLPSQLASTVFDAGTFGGTDTVWARLLQDDGALTSWQQFTVTVPAPSLTVTSVPNATSAQVINLSSLESISDPAGVGYQKLELWDSHGTMTGGQFVINGVMQTGGHEIDVSPANIANTVFDAGTSGGTDTMWARLLQANDMLTTWEPFTVTVPAPSLSVNGVPSATKGQVISLSNLVAISDPGNVGYQQLELWDSDGTVAGGQFVINGVAQAGGHEIDVLPSQLAGTVFDAGTSGGADTMWARLLQVNGTLTAWEPFSVSVLTPSLSVNSISSATKAQVINLSSLVTISNPSNIGYQQLELWDSDGTMAGGQFVINGVAQAGGHEIDVLPSQLAGTVFDAGTSGGADTMWARLLQANGTLTTWEQFSVTVPTPSLSVSNISNATKGQVINLSNLVTITDSGNVGYQKLELWDSEGSVAGGQFAVNGVAQTGGHEIDVSPTNVANTAFDAGTLGGTDTLWARLLENSGTLTGWQQFTVTVPTPTLTVHNDTTATPAQVINLSSLVTISDPSAVGYQKLELWDSDGTAATGQFMVNGVAQIGGHEIDVTPANVANTVFDEGTTGNTDTLWAQLLLNNGTLTGWQQFTVVDPVTVAQGATVELAAAYAGSVTFAGSTGTLQLDSSTAFTGTVAGMTGQDTLDLRDINFASIQTPTFSGNSSGGTLSVIDGTHIANIALLGNYMASTFVASSDGHGGTAVVDPLLTSSNQQTILSQSQHT